MTLSRIKFLFVLPFIFQCCTNEGMQPSESMTIILDNSKVIRVSELEGIQNTTESDHNKKPQYVNDSNIENQPYIALNELLDSCTYIKLETTPDGLIGKIDKLLLHKDRIYILDSRLTKTLFIFNMDGSFQFKIRNIGNGSGDFYEPSNFYLLDNEQIEIFDRIINKIIRYDQDGNFLRENTFDYQVMSYAQLNDNRYMFYAGCRYNPKVSEDSVYNLFITDSNLNLETKAFALPMSMRNLGYGSPFVFSEFNNGLLYSTFLDNNIYSLDSLGRFVSKYSISFDQFSLPKDIILTGTYENRKKWINKITAPKYAANVQNALETDEFLFFNFTFRNKLILNYYNKLTERLITGQGYLENYQGTFMSPISTYNNAFVHVFEPHFIYQNHFMDELVEKIENNSPRLSHLMSDWKPNSNPIIVLTYL